jgi:hypothetical protein
MFFSAIKLVLSHPLDRWHTEKHKKDDQLQGKHWTGEMQEGGTEGHSETKGEYETGNCQCDCVS